MVNSPVDIFGGADLRCEALLQELKSVIYERARGMPIPSIIGTLRILELEIIREQQ